MCPINIETTALDRVRNNGRWGPFFVAFGAAIWATDTMFRADVARIYSPELIVLTNHLLCLPIVLGICAYFRREFSQMTRKDWLSVLFLGIGNSVIATILFTKAFAITTNYSIPILIQKIQPVIVFVLAYFFLGERLPKSFWLWASMAIVGAYVFSFGSQNVFASVAGEKTFGSVWLSLAAAGIWAIGGVVGREVSSRFPYGLVTALRYLVATVVLTGLSLLRGELTGVGSALSAHTLSFVWMAWISGFFALAIYYLGLRGTKASVATLCELSYPLSAVVLNWIFLNSTLDINQIIGALVLIFSITVLSLTQARTASFHKS